GIFEDLFECEEFQDAEIHGRMEAQPALVGTDPAVHLDAESAIDLDISLIVKPGNAEHNDALGFYNALKNLGGSIFGMLLQHQPKRFKYFLDGLVELGLGRVLGFNQIHYAVNIIARNP